MENSITINESDDSEKEAALKFASKYVEGSSEQFYSVQGFKAGITYKNSLKKKNGLFGIVILKRLTKLFHNEAAKKFSSNYNSIQTEYHFKYLWDQQKLK